MGGQDVPLHRRILRHHKIPGNGGVLVIQIEPGSPAERAGIREGDIVVEFDGVGIERVDELYRLLTEDRVGKSTEVVALRGLDKLALFVTPADAR